MGVSRDYKPPFRDNEDRAPVCKKRGVDRKVKLRFRVLVDPKCFCIVV